MAGKKKSEPAADTPPDKRARNVAPIVPQEASTVASILRLTLLSADSTAAHKAAFENSQVVF